MQTDTSVLKLDINLIIPNKYQPRKLFEDKELTSLAESIKTYGIINPILVRKKEDKYEIIAGERRFRAAKQIGLTEIPVIVKSATEQEMAELALIENLERQGLTPIEEAKSYEEIMRIGNQTQSSLAEKLGKSQAAIANKIRLLSLPEEIQDALANKRISERHARSLMVVKDKEKQLELLQRIMREKLTVKETEQIINAKEINEEEIKQAINDIMKSLDITEIESKLEEQIGNNPSEKTEENIKNDSEEHLTKESEEKIEIEKDKKEDDNMNNGNFFPNFDNNNAANNASSLNMMNVQSMNQAPIAAAPEMVMPTVEQPIAPVMEPQLIVPTQPIEAQSQPMSAQVPQSAPIDSAPNFELFGPQPMMNQTDNMNNSANPMENVAPATDILQVPQQPIMETPLMNEAPLFGPSIEPISLPEQPQITVPEVPSMVSPVMDTSLFNPEAVMPVADPLLVPNQELQNTFEVPVMPMDNTPVPPVQQNVDKLTDLKNILTSNGYGYKVYSNETEDCIIIELPKN